MSAKVTARPRRLRQSKTSKLYDQFQASVEAKLRRLHRTDALLTATQFATNHETRV